MSNGIAGAVQIGAEILRSAAFVGFIVALVKGSPYRYAMGSAIWLACVSAILGVVEIVAAPGFQFLEQGLGLAWWLGARDLQLVTGGAALVCAGAALAPVAKRHVERQTASVLLFAGALMVISGPVLEGEHALANFTFLVGALIAGRAHDTRAARAGRDARWAIGFGVASAVVGLTAGWLLWLAEGREPGSDGALAPGVAASATQALAMAAAVCWLAAALPTVRPGAILRRTAIACGAFSIPALGVLVALLVQRGMFRDLATIGVIIVAIGLVPVAWIGLHAWERARRRRRGI